eukprot:scaffold1833_cov255-Pinguiococcus_pyrenoidosus.AAC.3
MDPCCSGSAMGPSRNSIKGAATAPDDSWRNSFSSLETSTSKLAYDGCGSKCGVRPRLFERSASSVTLQNSALPDRGLFPRLGSTKTSSSSSADVREASMALPVGVRERFGSTTGSGSSRPSSPMSSLPSVVVAMLRPEKLLCVDGDGSGERASALPWSARSSQSSRRSPKPVRSRTARFVRFSKASRMSRRLEAAARTSLRFLSPSNSDPSSDMAGDVCSSSSSL